MLTGKGIRWWALFVTLAMVAGTGTASAQEAKKSDRLSFDSNGVKLNYIVKGEGEPVVLIHGFCANHLLNWAPVIEDLSKDHKVIAYDNRGHGQSGKPHDPSAYGMEMVEDVVRLMDHLGIEKAHIAGYSMGGFITSKLLSTHPDRMLSATLGGAGWTRPGDVLAGNFMDELAASLERGDGITPLILRLNPAGKPAPTPERLNAMNQMIKLTNDTKALAAVIRGMKGFQVTESDWLANKVPTLALIGEIDPLKDGVDALDELDPPNLKIVSIEGADHMNAFLRPEFLAALREFITVNSPARATVAEPVGAK